LTTRTTPIQPAADVTPTPAAHRRIACTDRSTSVSSVDQFDTEIRIAARPCHVVKWL
jgi:hypothetical protein